ncbi:type II toxin-antitoxin system RelE/ParE family toxin [Cerasicoccus frondis]|uniref:type II toxin-antitoxin system RelE/ParE family toxin n=1 Tax=Cerasicoccus frondis TaxID=490090 RepID=UPI0028524BBA|nr:type II toxin-antitoxin system RelE/ParE family toxin [Cerasicoccus frondis]
MIKGFASKDTEKLWNGSRCRSIPSDIQQRALQKLRFLDAAESVNDLRIPPSNHLEQLRGARAGQWSIRINIQWRICFKWEDGNARDVEIVDYH